MAHGPQRPPPFQPGTKLSEHYIVEGLVRLSEGRMYYLANDDRKDRPFRFCWSCGADNTPRNGTHCLGCGVEMSIQRFLVVARWNSGEFEPFTRFFEKQLSHPLMITPIDLFVQADLLCSIIPWDGESLLVDDASPIPGERIWNLAEQTTGLIAFLHNEGISLRNLRPANYLIRDNEGTLLFDLEVQEIFSTPVPEEQRGREITFLGEMLRRYTPAAAPRLRSFFQQTQDGSYSSPLVFGRALEQLIDEEFESDPTSHAVTMTDVGLIRIMNEDNWNWVQLANEIMLYVVADGMGGHQCGEVASCMAVDTICQVARSRLEILSEVTSDTLENTLDEAFQASNNAIKDHSERMGNDMGTTLVAALVMRNELALIANVGDSRGYLLRNHVLHQVTRDHSLVARMVEQNRITAEEARSHPHSNILLRTVGTERNVDIDIFQVELEPGDQILLCSDGLWGEVEDEDIEAILNHHNDVHVACRDLVRAAHHGGGKDNVSAMIVEIPA